MLGLMLLLLRALPPLFFVCVEASLNARWSFDVREALFMDERFRGEMSGGICHNIGGVRERSLKSGIAGRSVVLETGRMSPLESRSSLGGVASGRLVQESGRLAPVTRRLALTSWRLAPEVRWLAPVERRLAPVERRLALLFRRLAPVEKRLAPVSGRLAPVERRLAPEVVRSSVAIWLVPDGGGDWASILRRFAVSRWSGVGRVLRLAIITPSSGGMSWRLLTTRRGVVLLRLLRSATTGDWR
ncbi:at-rich interactive domain-containing protein 4b-like isoform x1 protein [Lasius niger]|uniref:At-rich interactive domain-containing protein 4b-like isoform x1 protein n=1 Tax=Lasius niger TaxID=67767 RepID=A0A0J7KKT2_LASNI|nr:at-rich interactive domain-containing protein 4b-like isoform x1 protein [Lasius niger]